MSANPRVQEAIRARLGREPGISQRALAIEMGITPTQLGEYLRGQRRPRAAQLVRMSGPLGVSPRDLADSTPAVAVPADETGSVLLDLTRVVRAVHRTFASEDCSDLAGLLERAERCIESRSS